MKQKVLTLLLTLITLGAVAQTQTIRLHENVNKLNISTFETKDGTTYTRLSFDGSVSMGDFGTPDLPKVKHLIALPIDATPTIKIKGYTTQEFTLNELGVSAPLAPIQPTSNQEQGKEDTPFTINHKAYATDAFIQNEIATVEVLGTLRGIQIAQVEINPVDYNPARGVVRQYSDIDVEVEYDAPTSEIVIPAHLQSPYFDVVYKALSNSDNIVTRTAADDYSDHPDLTKYPVRMLIVANRMFEETLKPFVEWKTQKGFDVEVAYTDVIGEWASDIRSYVQGRYNNAANDGKAAPSFLVLVGDVDQVPASNTYTLNYGESPFKSDYEYGNLGNINNDPYPDIYYGRLSAETTTQLKNIIDKIIYYEKYLFEDPSYLSRATIISGHDKQGAHNTYTRPQMKYLVANHLNAEGGFTHVYEYGVNDENNPLSSESYTGCYDSERFRVGFMLYTAHADQYRWGDPLLNGSDIPKKDNKNQFPFVIGSTCLSGDFGFTNQHGKVVSCVGEYFLREPMGGAVTYIGSSPTSAWASSATWGMGQLKDNSSTWTFENTTLGAYDAPFVSDYVSAGGILFCGNLAVNWERYWKGFNILGDPSLIPYFSEADPIDATYSPTIPVGATTYTVVAPQRSHVALSVNGNKLLSSALVGAEGSVTLSFDAITSSDNVTLVITKPQHKPVIANLTSGTGAIEDITVSSKLEKIEVFNLQGVLVRTVDGEAEFTTDDLAPGTYIVVSTSTTDRKVEKMVVQ